MLAGFRFTSLICIGVSSLFLSASAHAECRINDTFGQATHALVTGIWHTPESEILFNVPGAGVGNNSAVVSSSITYAGGSQTLANHLRLRVRVKNKSSTGISMVADSSAPLSCVNCSSNATIPLTKVSWTEGTANETRGTTSGNGQFTGGVQSLIYAQDGSDNIFNLQFNFANDEVYPAGTYKGAFVTRGIPQ